MSTKQEKPFLSIVIPAYNEEARLPNSLKRLESYLVPQSYTWEIIVVDDGSQDRTPQIVRDFAEKVASNLASGVIRLLQPGHQGKGGAVRRGMLSARGDLVLFTDADLSTPIEEVEKMIPFIEEGYEVVIASRGLRESRLIVREPWYRELLGRAGNLLIQAIAVPGIRDTQCGFKLFTHRSAQEVFSRSVMEGISFDVEVLFLARRLGFRIKEVPVTWIYDRRTRIRLVRDSYRMLRDLVRIRWIHREVRRVVEPSQGVLRP